jgi:LuxR family transcriptional regulator, maltose regulon positive regulatory protein
MAAKKAAPTRKKPMPLLTPEYMLGITTFTMRYFEELFSRLKTPHVLVFDNYQAVSSDSKLHEVISHGMSVIPEKITIIVLSRREPPPQFVALRANDKVSSLGWNELCFTIEESRELISVKGSKEVKDEALTKFYGKIKGWAAGLVLTLEAAKIRAIDYQMLDTLTPKEVFDYFAGEIFEKTDKETQDFLLKSSFLPTMPEQLAEKLTGFSRAGQILSKLSKDNFFTEKTHHSAPSYQYHPLFREFLLRNAEKTFPAEDILAIRKTSAELLEAVGHIEDAAELMIDAGNWEGLTQLICKNAPSLLLQGRSKTLEEWLIKIPGEVLDKIPWLIFWRGVCRMSFNPTESHIDFKQAFGMFEALGDTVGTLLSLSSAVDTILNAWDDFTLLDFWIERLDNYIEHNLSFPSPEIEAQVATAMAGALAWRQPQRNDIKGWMEKALSLSRQSPNMNNRLRIYTFAIHYYTWIGEWEKCIILADELKGISESPAASALILLAWKSIGSMMYPNALIADEKSIQPILEGLRIAETSGIHILDHAFFAQGSYNAFNLGDMAMAGMFLQKLGSTPMSGQRNAIGQYYFITAWYNLLLGNVPIALTYAEKALNLVIESGAAFPEFLCRFLMAQLLHETRRYKEALTHLSLAGELVYLLGTSLFEFVHLLLSAQFAMDKGEEKHCLEALSKAMALGKKHDFKTMVFVWRKPVMSRLCAKALEAGIEVDYVQDLIRKLKLVPDSSSPEIETWPYPLRIYTLGHFEIVKDGVPLRFSGKVQKKPLEMLKAIISLGVRDVNEDQLMDCLWPEAAGDAANLSFRTTLHRLRKMIGIEEAMQSGERRLALDQQYCWVDIWAFQRATKRIADLWREKNQENSNLIIDLSEKTISMYKGDFLSADDTLPWTFTMRERLREIYIRLVNMLGHCCEETGQWERAIECYKKALDADILQEEFYRYLMLCYEKLGRHAEALRTYDRCHNAFHTMLGVEPSSKTEEIARRLLK